MSILCIAIVILLMLMTFISPQAGFIAKASEAHPVRVVDEADLLTVEEENTLLDNVNEMSERHQLDVVIVTLQSLNGEDIQNYAADYYDYNGYGMGDNYDGIMFIMSMEEREWFILTTGRGIELFSDREIDSIGETIVPYLGAGDYVTAFEMFTNEVDLEVEFGAEEGAPNILISLAAGLVLGFIPALIVRGKLKSVHMQSSAGRYEDRGSRNLTVKQDIFLYHTINRVPKPKENSGGGSTTFSGSSGRSHGGRGGGF